MSSPRLASGTKITPRDNENPMSSPRLTSGSKSARELSVQSQQQQEEKLLLSPNQSRHSKPPLSQPIGSFDIKSAPVGTPKTAPPKERSAPQKRLIEVPNRESEKAVSKSLEVDPARHHSHIRDSDEERPPRPRDDLPVEKIPRKDSADLDKQRAHSYESEKPRFHDHESDKPPRPHEGEAFLKISDEKSPLRQSSEKSRHSEQRIHTSTSKTHREEEPESVSRIRLSTEDARRDSFHDSSKTGNSPRSPRVVVISPRNSREREAVAAASSSGIVAAALAVDSGLPPSSAPVLKSQRPPKMIDHEMKHLAPERKTHSAPSYSPRRLVFIANIT